MLYNLPIDPLMLIIGFSALSLVLFVAVIVCIIKMNKLYRRYDMFMRGKDAESLEETMAEIMEELREFQVRDRAGKEAMKQLSKKVKSSFQKFGYVKYNAFKGMGGNLSFVVAMLDDNNSGFVLDVVHSREGCYLYLKEVEEGATEVLLGSEEQEALEQALGYVKKTAITERIAKKLQAEKEEEKQAEEKSFSYGEPEDELPEDENNSDIYGGE